MERIWGFDIGTTSIGFAAIDYDEDAGTGKILLEGVRIFPESRTPDKLDPLNQNRRAARLLRRQIRRRRLRRKLLRQAFADAGLLPRFGTPDWDALMNPDESDPYRLRTRGLSERLDPFELGRALYHLMHRRGFLSARRPDLRPDEQKAREKDEGPVKKEIKVLEEKLAGRTLGEYVATDPGVERKRNRHIHRQMVVEEFDRLWQAQAPHHRELLTDELRKRLRDILLYQRPIFWRVQTLGVCPLESKLNAPEPVCPKGSWIGQQFLMYQHLNNLRVRFPGSPPRALYAEERVLVLEKLQRQANMSFEGVRTPLRKLWKERGLPTKPEITLEAGGEKKLLGNRLEAHFVEVFGEAWDTHPARERLQAEFFDRLFQVHNRFIGKKRIELRRQDEFFNEITPEREKFIAEVQAGFSLTREQAEQLANFELPTGWLRYSEKAIRKLLPFLEQGHVLNATGGALDLAYPGWRSGTEEIFDRLPSHPKKMPVLRNPTVNRALNELRKVVNNLLRAYGKPDRIRLELLRELKKTKKQRQDKTKHYRSQQERRQKAADDLREKDIVPTAPAIEKWLLWQEFNEYCPYPPYLDQKIGFDALFRRGEFQVEHIFPLSRSLDNSYLNKTLCPTDVNREKGERTPYEFYSNEPAKWQEIKERVEQWVKANKELKEKVGCFLREDYPPGQEFLEERQKADTSYAAVEARKFLARLGVPVDVVSGPVTAQLRSQWSLNSILNPQKPWAKNRGDHRHHAVDALAVAHTSPAYVKRLSDYYARERRGEKPRFEPPWKGFHQEVDRKTQAIVVSHRVQRKVSGPLHKLTYYGDTGKEVTEAGITYRYFVTRKKVEELSDADIEGRKKTRIRDKVVRELVQKHVAQRGGTASKAFPPYPALVSPDTGEAREIRKVRLLVKQQVHLMMPLRPGPKTFADLAGNHHMALYKLPDGTIRHETVSLFEATRRLKVGEPVVRRQADNGARFLFALSPGDILELTDQKGERGYVVVRYCNEKGRVFYKPVAMADEPKPEVSFGPLRFAQPGIRKVAVDPIGRVRPAND